MLAVPTVVAVPGATKRINDGDWVELDGVAGTVALLTRGAQSSGVAAREGALA